MSLIRSLLFALLSGFLLFAAWPVSGFFPIMFIAWIPLLFLENELSKTGKASSSFFLYSLLSMFVWNVCTTWWIKNASLGGSALAIVANSILMAIVLYCFHRIKVKKGERIGYIAFVSFWMAFEYIHLRWDISWPWLNLGNVFATQPKLIQWYQFTGAFGGTLWILVANVLFFKVLIQYLNEKQLSSQWKLLFGWLIFPSVFSLLMFYSYEEKNNPINVLIVQPNIDPYNEKFDGLTSAQQLQKLLNLTNGKLDNNTDFLIGPETALVDYIWEHETENSEDLKVLKLLILKYPRLNVLIGASTAKLYLPNEKISATARKLRSGTNIITEYYDSYNTALQLDFTGKVQLYHKSKLVPGVEKMPWPALFKYIEKFAINLGGISGSLGMQDERVAFKIPNAKHASGPIVCYESIYGEYVGEYVKKGADFLAIITNDGWWGDTPGYKQHLTYGTLRAIETRRSIVRSANTGISAIINQRGEIISTTKWWIEDTIKATINTNDEITFYTRFGDYLGLIAIVIALCIIAFKNVL